MIKEAGGYILDFEGQNCQATNAPHFIAAGSREMADRLAGIVIACNS
jgi:hypothetical protein